MSSAFWDPNPFALDRRSRDEIALFLAKATLAAGPAVMEEYERGCDVASKADGSPVTSADHRAEIIICECLASIAPKLPVCAEELVAAGGRAQVAERFLLVDPLDGTREFLAGNGEFTINVALVERGAPIAGAVYAPAIGRLWVGGETAFTCEAPAGARIAWPRIASAHPHASRANDPDRFCKPLASRSGVGFLSQEIANRGDAIRGFVAQVLPHRRGPWRRLSAVCANDGMGHCGGRRGAARGRRRRSRSFGAAAFVRKGRERIAQRPFHRLGRRGGRKAIRILKSSCADLRPMNRVCNAAPAKAVSVNAKCGLLTIC